MSSAGLAQQPVDCADQPAFRAAYEEQANWIFEHETPWQLDRIDQPALPLDGEVVLAGSEGQGIDLYVVDTGVAPFNTRLYPRVKGGFTLFDDEFGWSDDHGHGTAVAAVAAGNLVGVAPKVRIYSVRVFKAGAGTTSSVVAGFDWIYERILRLPHIPAVVNYSGGGLAQPAVDWSVCRVLSLGVPVFVAAGNSASVGFNACFISPARLIQATAAGAIDRADQVAGFSAVGECVDYWAPGVDIEVPTLEGGTAIMSGTSFASPLGAGGAARGLDVLEQLSDRGILFLGLYLFREDFETGDLGRWSDVGSVPDDGE